jgi:hypothetical protein
VHDDAVVSHRVPHRSLGSARRKLRSGRRQLIDRRGERCQLGHYSDEARLFKFGKWRTVSPSARSGDVALGLEHRGESATELSNSDDGCIESPNTAAPVKTRPSTDTRTQPCIRCSFTLGGCFEGVSDQGGLTDHPHNRRMPFTVQH